MFCKKGVLKNFAIFTGKHLCLKSLHNKVTGLDVTLEDYLTCADNLASQINIDLVNPHQGRKPFVTFKVNKKFPETFRILSNTYDEIILQK